MPQAATHWKEAPDDHDYPAAENYLTLLVPPAVARKLVARMRRAPIARWKGKDLLRASRLPLLARDNLHVASDLRKVRKGQKLSPVLLVRGKLAEEVALQIADGYHRVCASYYIDENSEIPCRLVDAVTG